MTGPAERPRALSPELRTAFFYFAMGLSGGAPTAYIGIWFSQQGLTANEIGLVNAVPVLAMLFINMAVGRIADRAADWRQVIVLGALVAGFVPFGLFFVHDFLGILILWTLATIPIAAIAPVADAATLRMTRRNGTDYATIRAWATVGFMSAIFATGYLMVWLGAAWFVPLIAFLGIIRAATSLQLPRFRAPKHEATLAQPVGARRLIEVMKPWFILPLVGWAMVLGTHLVFNAFAALLWKEQGLTEDVIGLLIGAGALAEAAIMFAFKRFGTRYRARTLILLSAVVTVFRWAAMAFAPGVEILFALQMTQAVTFALGFFGCLHFIANWTSEDIAAEAQSFFVVLQQAMSVIAIAAFGWLVGLMGVRAYFVAAAFAALGAVLIWLSMRMQPPKQ